MIEGIVWNAVTALALAALAALGVRVRRRPAGRLDSCYDPADGERQAHRWGYTDTRFEFDDRGSVRLTGRRYPLAGDSLPHLVTFAEQGLGVSLRPECRLQERRDLAVPEPRIDAGLLRQLRRRFRADQVSVAAADRLVHSHGQLSVDEVYRLLYVDALARTVDAVCYPETEAEVSDLVRLARAHDLCLVPYGGGTNVTGALACPAQEARTIVSVDMGRMDRILWVEEEDLLACVQAGITGKALERQLGAMGYTCGHEPDSVELSTLGGWISTNASGMKKNRYGNIEDIVVEATLVSPEGVLEARYATPRNSTGVPPRALLFGSEGNFGIITKAILKIHPRPEVRRFASVVFPSFERGVEFLRDLRRAEVLPASIRLVSNLEFRFGQALKPRGGRWSHIASRIQKLVLFRVKGFDPARVAACTVLMEGTGRQVRQQRRGVLAAAARHGGISGGARNGKRGYMLTFAIAYIRDFFNQFQILGETFETSVPWSRIHRVTAAVERELASQARAHGIAGKPYLGYRVSQIYHSGVCIYFTMGFWGRGLQRPDRVFHEVETRLRQAILDNGGSLSHHHGVGKVRQAFLPQIQTESCAQVLRAAKRAIDPGNVFGIGNGVFGDVSPRAQGAEETLRLVGAGGAS